MKNFVCKKCGRDYDKRPDLCKCGEFGFNFPPAIRRIGDKLKMSKEMRNYESPDTPIEKKFDIILTINAKGIEQIPNDIERNVEKYFQMDSSFQINSTHAKIVATNVTPKAHTQAYLDYLATH